MVWRHWRGLYRVAHALPNRSGGRYQSSGSVSFAGGLGHRTCGVLQSTALAGSSRYPSTRLAWVHTLPVRAGVTGVGGEHASAVKEHPVHGVHAWNGRCLHPTSGCSLTGCTSASGMEHCPVCSLAASITWDSDIFLVLMALRSDRPGHTCADRPTKALGRAGPVP